MNDDFDNAEVEFDDFREDNPAHEAVSAGSILGELKAFPPEGEKPPEPKHAACEICHKRFLSQWGWYFGKWRLSAICDACADGNTLPTGFLEECKRPSTRQMSCPKCGIRRGVEPKLMYNLWHYELTCPHCGQYAVNVYRIRRTCAGCGEDFFVNDKNPKRECVKCRDRKSKAKGPF